MDQLINNTVNVTTGGQTEQFVKLPDGTGLWLTTTKYLQPGGEPLDRVVAAGEGELVGPVDVRATRGGVDRHPELGLGE